MPEYCVNSNPQPGSGDHEVHDLSVGQHCLPVPANRVALGWHSTCADAVNQAKQTYDDVNGCYYCANDCHTT